MSESLFGPKIDARPVFEHDRAVLIDLLRDLQPDEWQRPTACAPWLVRDVVAHLLGNDLSRLARTRDGHTGNSPQSGEPLPAFLHRFNQDWVSAASRVSPALLIDLFNTTSPQVLRMWRDLDLDTLGGPVSWAGPDPAPLWLDCARDFTEYWVHQQQIRDATGRPDTGGPTMVHMVLDTFLRALPHTLVHREDVEGTVFAVEVGGPGGGTWSWQRSGHHWRWTSNGPAAATTLVIDPDTLWRLCVRGIEPHTARQRVTVRGNTELADAALQIVSIIR
ncbi:MAG: maleylpyruvate isomerase family mycothiol-dependent enzyme [Pseudonocardiales bacterium]|nr:maleylpyruvate isomerase family mycothiol-dependent enzyme [Pseudonocardiales bacterium]MBV9729921.1 maleylpyruvate isomerase family mycothiol-dependent enzyme [Pseudonocardiales bacterium]